MSVTAHIERNRTAHAPPLVCAVPEAVSLDAAGPEPGMAGVGSAPAGAEAEAWPAAPEPMEWSLLIWSNEGGALNEASEKPSTTGNGTAKVRRSLLAVVCAD